jgi:hypothetical protein
VHGSTATRIGLGAVAGCIAAATLAVSGCGGGSSSSTGASGASGASGVSGSQVSATDYMTTTCTALVDLQSSIKKSEQPLPTGTTGAFKAAASKQVSEQVSALQQAANKIKNAGVPDVPDGEQYAADANTNFAVLMAAAQRVQKQVKALPTSSKRALGLAYENLAVKAKQQFAQIAQSAQAFNTNDELRQAAEQIPVCKPLLQAASANPPGG